MNYKECSQLSKNSLSMTEQEKKIFIRTLHHLSKLDGCVDSDEIQFIADVAKKLNIQITDDMKSVLPENEILAELKKITDTRTALELIKEMCFLGHADSNLSDEEILFIGHAGAVMGIEPQKIEEISDWVVDYIIWQEKGKLIFQDC